MVVMLSCRCALLCQATVAAVTCVAGSCALNRPLERVRKSELCLPVTFMSPESPPLGIAGLLKLRRATMATDVHAAAP